MNGEAPRRKRTIQVIINGLNIDAAIAALEIEADKATKAFDSEKFWSIDSTITGLKKIKADTIADQVVAA